MDIVAPSFQPAPLRPSLTSPPDAAARAAQVQDLLQGVVPRVEERQVLDVLEACSGPELNQLLHQVDVQRLVRGVDNHVLGPANRTELLHFLTEDKVADLDVEVRAALVESLQRGPTTRLEEQAVCNIFCATEGAELTDLKNRVDAGGDPHDAEGLLFQDIDDAAVRDAILGHIAGQAADVAGLKILSDIDDTFVCSLKDRRYPKGTIYPGASQLLRELDLGDGRAGDVTFLTARPTEPTGLLEGFTQRFLRSHGAPEASVLTGTISGLLSHERMATSKLESLWRYREVFPEYDAVLIGDSGQADIDFAFRALNSEGTEIPVALIHDVVGLPEAEREELRYQDIILFDTYVDAAVEAYDKGLIDREAVGRVADAAQAELAAVHFASAEQQAARQADMARALERVAALDSARAR